MNTSVHGEKSFSNDHPKARMVITTTEVTKVILPSPNVSGDSSNEVDGIPDPAPSDVSRSDDDGPR